MKKLVSLLLCILLCVPVLASAEVLEFEDFNLTLKDGDLYQLGVKSEGNTMFMVYPAYSDSDLFHANFGAAWTAEDLAAFLKVGDVDALTQTVLEGLAANLSAQGVKVNDKEILAKEVDAENGVLAVYMTLDLDYSGMGYDLQLVLHQEQVYVSLGEKGTYIFTFAADSNEKIMELLGYLDAVEIK